MYLHNSDYWEPLTRPIDQLIHSYYQGTGAKDMIDFCEMQLDGRDPKKAVRDKSIRENIQYLDGHCCDRIIDDLIQNVDTLVNKEKRNVNPRSRFLLWGAGLMGEECIKRSYLSNKIEAIFVGIVDSNKANQVQQLHGISIIAPDQIAQMSYDYIVIATEKYYREVYLRITEEFGVSSKRIINYDELFNLMALGN